MITIDDYFIGIDPGKTGGIAVLKRTKDSYKLIEYSIFDVHTYNQILDNYINANCITYLELAHSFPGQGVKSMFSQGENYGYIQGLLDSRMLEFVITSPQSWKSFHDLIGKTKQDSIDKVKEIFPGIDLEVNGKDSDGIAEAILIAIFAFYQETIS